MKSLKAISTLFTLAVLILSCKKEPMTQSGSNRLGVNNPLPIVAPEQTIISNWFNLPLSLYYDGTDRFLEGTESFAHDLDYDHSLHVELAYVMMPGGQAPVYKRLPMSLEVVTDTKTDEYLFQFVLTHTGFSVTVRTSDPVSEPDPAVTEQFNYRYIIIPKSTYHSLAIDWDNYDEVAQALNL